MNRRHPPGPPMTLGDMRAEPDLLEHQRLIIRALRKNSDRRARRPVLDATSAPTWQLVLVGVSAAVLFLVAIAALFVALLAS